MASLEVGFQFGNNEGGALPRVGLLCVLWLGDSVYRIRSHPKILPLNMDLTLFVRGKLDFIQRFYDATSAPFLTKMRQIEAQETPFDCSDPNSEYDEGCGSFAFEAKASSVNRIAWRGSVHASRMRGDIDTPMGYLVGVRRT